MARCAPLTAGGLLVEVRDDGPRTLRVDWLGRSNHLDPGALLRPWLESVLQEARQGGRGIEAHFEALEFFNSSTMTAVIQFIRQARAQGTRLAILFDGSQKWQALSFDALKSFELPDGLLNICSTTAAAAPATGG